MEVRYIGRSEVRSRTAIEGKWAPSSEPVPFLNVLALSRYAMKAHWRGLISPWSLFALQLQTGQYIWPRGSGDGGGSQASQGVACPCDSRKRTPLQEDYVGPGARVEMEVERPECFVTKAKGKKRLRSSEEMNLIVIKYRESKIRIQITDVVQVYMNNRLTFLFSQPFSQLGIIYICVEII